MIGKNQDYKRIAIVKLSAMGDIIHAMVALQFIKKKFPDLIIDWFVEKSFSEILKHNPHIDNIYELNLKSIKKDKSKIFEQISLVRKYSKNNYDLIIDAQGLLKSAIVSRLLGKNVVGFDKDSIREKFASFFYMFGVKIDYKENVIKRNLKVLCELFGISPSDDEVLNKEKFIYFEKNSTEFDLLNNDKKNILFVVGASWTSKMYSYENFIKLANLMDENIYILWASDLEKEIATKISENSKAIMLNKMNLNSLKNLISQMDLVVGNDTGPTHLAWGLNKKSITLFGNTPGYRNCFVSKDNCIIQSNSIVDPLKIDKKDTSINNIKVEEIFEIVRNLL